VKRRLGPIVSILLLLGLGTWVYLKEIKDAGTRQKAEEAKDRPISFERSALKTLAIKNEHGEIRLERQEGTWRITAPLAAEADSDAVEGLLSSVEMGRIDRRLGALADLKPYGLDPPEASLTLEVDGTAEARTLLLGGGNPIGGTFFALLPQGGEAAVVSSSLGEIAKKDLLSLRDKSLLSFDPWKVVRLRIDRGRETVRLEKPADGWKIQEPVEAPADGPTITDLLSALERLRAREFVTEKPGPADLRRSGLDPPAARMTLLQEGWDVEKTVLFGKPADDTRFARTVGREPILKVPGDFWEKVTTRVFDLRRKEVLGVGQYRIEKMTVAREGAEALVLSRQKDGSWTLSGLASGSVKAETVDPLLRTLGDLKALSFDDRPTEAVRASLSRRPVLDLTLQEEPDASGGTAKSQHVVIGTPDRTGRVRVRDMAWRPIALCEGSALEKITSQLDAIRKEAAEPKPSPTPPAPSASPAVTPQD
jgi:uncharacterized protein DUF4340